MLGPNFMLGLNTIMYSYLLFRTGLVPKPLAIFGMVTAVMLFIAVLLGMFGIVGTLLQKDSLLYRWAFMR